jgi:3-methyladenine DNA glycosylase AlkD
VGKAGARDVASRVDEVLGSLERLGSKRVRDDMSARYGIVTNDKTFGVKMSEMKKLAKSLGRDHALACALWDTGCYEARMLTTMVAEPDRVTPQQMERWTKTCDNWATVDTLCFNLFNRVPHAFDKIDAWHDAKDEFVRRTAYALMATLSMKDATRGDAAFLKWLDYIEHAATDERNFVKKGVSWALRGLGRRNAKLHTAALALAKRLSTSKSAPARWIGKEALKDLSKPGVVARLAKRAKARRKE